MLFKQPLSLWIVLSIATLQAPRAVVAQTPQVGGKRASNVLWAAISPTPPSVRTGPQHPPHIRDARTAVLEWFANKGVNVLPEEQVRKRLQSRLDLTSCSTDECARTIAQMLELDFIIRVTVWENMNDKFIEPTGVGVKLVFADPKEPPVEYSETVSHMDVSETGRTASVHTWQIYEERSLRRGRLPAPSRNATGGIGAANAAAATQSSTALDLSANSVSSNPKRSTLDLVGPIALVAVGAVALGIGIANLAASGSCETYSTVDPNMCLVGEDPSTGAAIAVGAVGLAAIGGGVAWYLLATPKANAPTNVKASSSSYSLLPSFVGYQYRF